MHGRDEYFRRLLGPDEIFVAPEVLTLAEQTLLVAWADEKLCEDRLLIHPLDPRNRTTPFRATDQGLTRLTRQAMEGEAHAGRSPIWVPKITEQVMDPLPPVFWEIRTRVISLLNLEPLLEDYYKGSFMNYILPGGGIHMHRDAPLYLDGEEFAIIRCNVLFRRALRWRSPNHRGS